MVLWLSNNGFNITTLIAGLGVSSVAIALAAQKTLENVIGAVTLFLSRPVKVGDFCRFGNHMGTLEDIGLRSSNIRTLDRTLVSIPNALFASAEIINYSARDHVRYLKDLKIKKETNISSIQSVLDKIKELFSSHEMISYRRQLVQLTDITDSAITIQLDAYTKTNDYNEYLKIAENLNIKVLEILKSCSVELATPETTVFMPKGSKEQL